jgi:hypothetical protein
VSVIPGRDEFLAQCCEREDKGAITYGKDSYMTDSRVMCEQAREEACDIFNYMEFLSRRFPQLSSATSMAKSIAFTVWRILLSLEHDERKRRGVGTGG